MKKDKPSPPKADAAKMEAALIAAEKAIDEATDILHYGEGQPVTALDGWQIEEIFNGLRGVMVQMDEALAHRWNQSTESAPKRARRRFMPTSGPVS